jgi:hypothetical protein
VKERKLKPFLERMLGQAVSGLAEMKQELFNQPVLQYKFTSPY